MRTKSITALRVLWISAVAATVALSLTVLAGFAPGIWICDLLSQFRLVELVLLLVCLLLLCFLHSPKMALLCLLTFFMNGAPIVSMFFPAAKSDSSEAVQLRILNYNTEFQHNRNYSKFEALVKTLQPDVICLMEVDQKWLDAIQATTKTFPYSNAVIKGPGMAIVSKFPIKNCAVKYFGKSHHPRLFAQLNMAAKNVNLILAHPTTPKSDLGYKERTEELAIIKDEMKTLSGPTLLVGDLNCGPWAAAFAELLKAGLRDSEQGFGPQPSWPARSGRIIEYLPIPPFVPIDHVLISPGISVLERRAGPAIGSDHMPVFLKLALPK